MKFIFWLLGKYKLVFYIIIIFIYKNVPHGFIWRILFNVKESRLIIIWDVFQTNDNSWLGHYVSLGTQFKTNEGWIKLYYYFLFDFMMSIFSNAYSHFFYLTVKIIIAINLVMTVFISLLLIIGVLKVCNVFFTIFISKYWIYIPTV